MSKFEEKKLGETSHIQGAILTRTGASRLIQRLPGFRGAKPFGYLALPFSIG